MGQVHEADVVRAVQGDAMPGQFVGGMRRSDGTGRTEQRGQG